MTDDLDTLRPEVREAMRELDGKAYPGSRTYEHWQTIRAELLRLSDAEAELAALKARIGASRLIEPGAQFPVPGYVGKRLRLVVVEE